MATIDTVNIELVGQWATDMRTRNLSERTIAEYTRQVTIALDKLPPLDVLTAKEIRAFMTYELERGLSKESVNQTVKALNSFCAWATDNNALSAIRNFPTMRALPRQLPRSLSVEQCENLLALEAARGDWIGLRNRALWTLQWGAGLRISEALSFTLKDARDQRDVLVVTGKGGKQRLVPMLPRVWEAIGDYLTAMQETVIAAVNDETPLFVTEHMAPLTPRDAQRSFERAREALQLPVDATPHSLRHSFATHLLNARDDGNNGPTIRDVQELLGHESISTTAIYAHVANDRLLRQYDDAHPRGAHVGAGAPNKVAQSNTSSMDGGTCYNTAGE